VAQRLRRPIAPHLSIYQPQLTWYMSAANRIAGVALGGSVYVFGITYAVAPLAGFHAESAAIAATAAALPLAVKIALKASLATPFVFHSVNGLRHLTWDTARELSISGVYRTGYAVLGASALGAGYLTFFA
jgi:succinate dehydrogenase (ubiquinone) cytochrome b560 subunit